MSTPDALPALDGLPIFDEAPPPGLAEPLTAGFAGVEPPAPAGAPAGRAPLPRTPVGPAPGRAPSGAGQEAAFWREVTAMRETVSQRLSSVLGDQDVLDERTRREVGRAQIEQVVRDHNDALLGAGSPGWDALTEGRMKKALFDALFGLGRFQPLVDDPDVENLMVTGNDPVLLIMADGSRVTGPPVADSDEDLIRWVNFVATRADNERSFTRARPLLDLTLPGGQRMAATAWVTPRPRVAIRCSRHRDVSLAGLRQLGEMDVVLEEFLAAAVRARKSIVVSGAGQGSGKTTLVRALAGALDPREVIVTIETERELFLNEQPEAHHEVVAFEARIGTGEGAGEITLDDFLAASLRYNADRIIVGEVRGREVVAMFKAMQSGNGSLSTIHASNARDVIGRLVTCAVSDSSVSEVFAHMLVAQNVDLIVYLSVDIDPVTRRRHRYISQVIEVEPGETAYRPAVTDVFGPDAQGRAVPRTPPSFLADLEAVGFDRNLLNYPHGTWDQDGAR